MPTLPTSVPPDVLNALREGRQIQAIKLLRKATGLGLADAKGVIDGVLREQAPGQAKAVRKVGISSMPIRPRDPNLSPGEMPRTSGGPWAILLLVGAILAGWFLLR